MSAITLCREYRLKVYLNMNHYIIVDGKQGWTHPHTWEFVVHFAVTENTFREFTFFEKLIEDKLEKYQNRLINDIEPFDEIVPTIENVTDFFAVRLEWILREYGCELMALEGRETPTHGYIVSRRNEPAFLERMEKIQNDHIHQVIHNMVGRICSDREQTHETKISHP